MFFKKSCFFKRMFANPIQNYDLDDIWLYYICIALTALQCDDMLIETDWCTHFCWISLCVCVCVLKLCLTSFSWLISHTLFFTLSWKKWMPQLKKTSKKWAQISQKLIVRFLRFIFATKKGGLGLTLEVFNSLLSQLA